MHISNFGTQGCTNFIFAPHCKNCIPTPIPILIEKITLKVIFYQLDVLLCLRMSLISLAYFYYSGYLNFFWIFKFLTDFARTLCILRIFFFLQMMQFSTLYASYNSFVVKFYHFLLFQFLVLVSYLEKAQVTSGVQSLDFSPICILVSPCKSSSIYSGMRNKM